MFKQVEDVGGSSYNKLVLGSGTATNTSLLNLMSNLIIHQEYIQT